MQQLFTIEVAAKLILEGPAARPRLIEVQTSLQVSENMNQSAYFDASGILSPTGHKVSMNALVQGLIATIKGAHAIGYGNEVQHLEWVIAELGRAFAAPSDISHATS